LATKINLANEVTAIIITNELFVVDDYSVPVSDVVRASTITGETLVIDWQSIKLRTFNNLLIQIPNETPINFEPKKISKCPSRQDAHQ
tara:strand:+ start:1381 stop:1644 length:264 start_codon:yes stop_codon:yes gene_type:complete